MFNCLIMENVSKKFRTPFSYYVYFVILKVENVYLVITRVVYFEMKKSRALVI